MRKSIAILAAGGPAPGINTVTAVLTQLFIKEGYNVIGLHEGYSTLFKEKWRTEELTEDIAERIFMQGGSYLQMSRYKPTKEEFNSDFFTKNNVRLLVTIGGDDTASTAMNISNFLKENDIHVSTIHVPKTIDNDLPLPHGMPTFGFNTAVEEGARIAKTLKTDAETSKMWFITTIMGRAAGHLGLAVGAATNLPIIIIPELFQGKEITIDLITDIIISSIIKRKKSGKEFGVAIISEGVFDVIKKEELYKAKIDISWDAHGNPEWGNVSKAHIINKVLKEKMSILGLKVKSRPEELGYELRCCPPIAFDINLCSLLAYGVVQLFKAGKTGCLVTVDPEGVAQPLYLNDVSDDKGRVVTRQVNLESALFKKTCLKIELLQEKDYDYASIFLKKHQDYIFTQYYGK